MEIELQEFHSVIQWFISDPRTSPSSSSSFPNLLPGCSLVGSRQAQRLSLNRHALSYSQTNQPVHVQQWWNYLYKLIVPQRTGPEWETFELAT